MNLKRLIGNVITHQQSDPKLKNAECEKSLLRSDKDWEIIDNYLYPLILKRALESKRNKHLIKLDRYCIELACPLNDSGENILLTNKEELCINHKDIERFCRQHHFGIRFINHIPYDKYETSFYYDDIRTRFYLIKV